MDALDALRRPRLHRLQGTHEHLVEPQRVRAVVADHVVRVDDVLQGLRHLRRELRERLELAQVGAVQAPVLRPERLAVLPRHVVHRYEDAARIAVGEAEDHALVDEALERLRRRHGADVEEHQMPEARVEEVQHGVLGAADVEVDRQPLLQQLRVAERLVVRRIDVAEVIPAAAGPLRHRVRLADALLAGLRVDDVHPVRRLRERRLAGARRLVVVEGRERERKVFLGDERVRAVLPVDDGERLAPVALAREEPVAELVLRLRLADALLDEPLDHRLARVVHGHPGEEAGGHHDAGGDVGERRVAGVGDGLLGGVLRRVGVRRGDDLDDRQAEDLGEVEVALVVRRHGHDRAGAVGGEHVVGDEDRDRLAVDGVDAPDALEADAGLLLVQLGALQVALRGGLLLVGDDGVRVPDRAVGEPLLDEPVLRRQHHVRRPEERVAPGRVNLNYIFPALLRFSTSPLFHFSTFPLLHPEPHQRAFRLADPVALHLLDALGPVERVEPLEEALGVGGDLEHPLAHRLADDGVAAALGLAVDDLLVREHRAERRTPVHRHLGDVGETLLVELLEDPLSPAVVFRVGRVDLAVPVVGEAEGADLLAEAVDVLLRRHGRVRARLDGVLLGREAEGVPPHRVQDVEALHALVAAEDVRRRIALRVADVESGAGRIGEHVEAVELLAPAVRVRLEGLVLEPELLPLLLDGRKIVFAHFCF